MTSAVVGTVTSVIPASEIAEKFWPYVEKTEMCWLWTAGKTNGYGCTRHMAGKQHYAHRIAYQLLVGPIPEGLEIDHLCRNRSCVNPAHLEAVAHRINTTRGRRTLRCPQGHLYAGNNLIVLKRGDRRCRKCHNAREQERRNKLKAATQSRTP